MTYNCDSAMLLDQEQEALWYLGGQRIINGLGERRKGTFRLIEFLTPAGTFITSRLRKKEDEALYIIEGEVIVSCEGQTLHAGPGTFLFLPCAAPYSMEISTAGPLRYLTWLTPAGFAQEVTKMGNPDQPLILAPPPAPERVKILRLADLLRETSRATR